MTRPALYPCTCGPHSDCPADCDLRRERRVIVGIDPGAQGAVAWMTPAGHLIEARDLPVEKINGRSVLIPSRLAAMLREPGRLPSHAYLERVATRPGEGAVGAFSFGRGYGMIEGVLAALAIPVTLVTPASWKKHHRLPADKAAARHRASQLWPGLADSFALVKHDGRAESALLALYGAQQRNSMGGAL